MEKAKFEEAKNQIDIIDKCDIVFADNKQDEMSLMFPIPAEFKANHISELVFSNEQVTRSFLRLVENEKSIAEQKLKEI